MQRSFSGSLALTKLRNRIIEVKNKNKQSVTGLFIPIDDNHLVKGKNGALYLPIRVITHNEADKYGQHGFVAQTVDSETWKQASDEQKDAYKMLPILGNIKDFDAFAGDLSGTMEDIPDQTIDDSDDIPY